MWLLKFMICHMAYVHQVVLMQLILVQESILPDTLFSDTYTKYAKRCDMLSSIHAHISTKVYCVSICFAIVCAWTLMTDI